MLFWIFTVYHFPEFFKAESSILVFIKLLKDCFNLRLINYYVMINYCIPKLQLIKNFQKLNFTKDSKTLFPTLILDQATITQTTIVGMKSMICIFLNRKRNGFRLNAIIIILPVVW